MLHRVWVSNSLNEWALAAGVAVGLLLVLLVIKAVAASRVSRIADRTSNRIDDAFVDLLNQTKWFSLLAVSLYAAAQFLHMPRSATRLMDRGLLLIAFLQIGFWLQSVVRSTVAYSHYRHRDAPGTATLASAFGFLAKLVVWSVIALLILSSFGVKVTALIAGLGVGGIAAALAVQNVLGDLFASLSLYFDRPFDLGDFIVVDTFMGSVERIGMRSTRVRSLSGEQIVFSNSDLSRSRIRNFKRMAERRVEFRVGVEYTTAPEQLERVPAWIREAIERQTDLRFDRAHLKQFGEFSVVFEAVYFVLTSDYNVFMDRQQAVHFELYRRFREQGIRFGLSVPLLARADAQSTEPLSLRR